MIDVTQVVQRASMLPPFVDERKLDFLLGQLRDGQAAAKSSQRGYDFNQRLGFDRIQLRTLLEQQITLPDLAGRVIGEILWQRRFDEPIWTCHLLAETDILVHLELSLIRLNAEGAEQWIYSHADIITEIQLQENQLRLTDFDNHQFGLNLMTGLVVPAPLEIG